MIDHIMVMNLERREDKWLFMQGALWALGFPVYNDDILIRFISHEALDYPDLDAIHHAAVADGFEHFNAFRSNKPSNAAWMWTWASALRTIRDMEDKIVLLLIDDFTPPYRWSWGRFNQLVAEVVKIKHHGELRGIQLVECGEVEGLTDLEAHTSMLQKGFAGNGDQGFILSSSGAALLLEETIKYPFSISHGIIKQIAEQGVSESKYFDGLWHTLENLLEANMHWESDL